MSPTRGYPGVFDMPRIASLPMALGGAVTHTESLMAFGAGWWIACIVCEFVLRRKVRSS